MAGLEEAVYKNVDACKQIAAIIRSSFGPNGKFEISLFCFVSNLIN